GVADGAVHDLRHDPRAQHAVWRRRAAARVLPLALVAGEAHAQAADPPADAAFAADRGARHCGIQGRVDPGACGARRDRHAPRLACGRRGDPMTTKRPRASRPLSARASELRRALLELHGAIVAVERRNFERKWGRVQASEFLHQLVQDEAWSWLRPLSALIVGLDAPEGATEDALFSEARRLLKPDAAGMPFQRRYASLIQQSPDVAFAHGIAIKALKKSP